MYMTWKVSTDRIRSLEGRNKKRYFREGGNPEIKWQYIGGTEEKDPLLGMLHKNVVDAFVNRSAWIPAYAGMTTLPARYTPPSLVIPLSNLLIRVYHTGRMRAGGQA